MPLGMRILSSVGARHSSSSVSSERFKGVSQLGDGLCKTSKQKCKTTGIVGKKDLLRVERKKQIEQNKMVCLIYIA